MHLDSFQWISTIVSVFIIFADWISFINFRKSIEKPVKKVIIRKILSKYKDTEKLYRAYKELPSSEFKLAKIDLKSKEFEATFLHQTVDLFSKLIFTISAATVSIIVSISASLLSFMKDNKELQKDPLNNITINVNNIMRTFDIGLNFYQMIFLTSFLLCGVAVTHYFLMAQKKKLHILHLTIVEEIVDELKASK
ncbi:hypothetical protein N0M98_33480 [Paenibacillus doosanensis]|uniref:hypothetical protein n=1 Tax=Paenibacillus doosanensis TaxID=1229154 RepID=UPI002180106D|nr:hypothetical protein [Paenibacillus doosanensis]MCS7464997.1 hypothetical protein [Paenibacillus doosanensis]